jgi:cbb3-type cytochrome oxidase maturation protein
MTILYVVLPLATLLSVLAMFAFAWAARKGQFDDLTTPAVRLLCDELPLQEPPAGTLAKHERHERET